MHVIAQCSGLDENYQLWNLLVQYRTKYISRDILKKLHIFIIHNTECIL